LDQEFKKQRARTVRDLAETAADPFIKARLQGLAARYEDDGVKPPAICTGLTRIDSLVGGLHAGDLVIGAGRPGMGKSMLLTHVCKAATMDGAPALLISLEMPREQNIQRLITDIDYDEHPNDPLHYTWFRKGTLKAEQLDRAARAGNRLRQLPLEIFDTSGVTIHQIAAVAERFAARHKRMGVIAIDYLQIVQPSERYAGSKVQEVTEISNGLKALAKRVGWPVVAGCQLHRAVEGREQKRPRLADLRESGAIEQDADIVLGLYRPGYYIEEKRPEYGPSDPAWSTWKAEFDAIKHDLDISVLKNRNGPTGTAKLHVEIAANAIRNRADAR
jgi:replicative DNA helicase